MKYSNCNFYSTNQSSVNKNKNVFKECKLLKHKINSKDNLKNQMFEVLSNLEDNSIYEHAEIIIKEKHLKHLKVQTLSDTTVMPDPEQSLNMLLGKEKLNSFLRQDKINEMNTMASGAVQGVPALLNVAVSRRGGQHMFFHNKAVKGKVFKDNMDKAYFKPIESELKDKTKKKLEKFYEYNFVLESDCIDKILVENFKKR